MAAAATTTQLAIAGAAAMVAGMAVSMIGNAVVSKICPTKIPSPSAAISEQSAKSSNQYAITGARNTLQRYGYIPLILGRQRVTGPLAAKSWTWYDGDDQYFNMCVIWGHPDMTVTDFRIGDNPLSYYADVTHKFHPSTTGNDLVFFNRSVNENSINATLLESNGWTTREVGEAQALSVDIAFNALADLSSGDPKNRSVEFEVQYALVGTENWKTYAQKNSFVSPEQYFDTYSGADENDAWCDYGGTWNARQDGDEWKDEKWTDGKIRAPLSRSDLHGRDAKGNIVGTWSAYPFTKYKDKHKHHEWWSTEVTFTRTASTNTITCTANSTTPKTFSYEWRVPKGTYKIRIRRITEDATKSSIQDEARWATARAITNVAAFNTPIPICVSELRIKASDQLQNYVDDFNALCYSNIPVCHKKADGTMGWDTITESNVNKEYKDFSNYDDLTIAETSNPADHIRYLLTSRHCLNSPHTSAKIDEDSLAKFWSWCKKENFRFDYTNDTEESLWSRLVTVASAGRGAITLDRDGLFAVVIDNADKTPVQMFTPRNSWGFSMNRSFYKMPHALRTSYQQEILPKVGESDFIHYEEREGFIYMDGYNKKNATDIQEWNFAGKTDWGDLYKMGRYYLAAMRLRPYSVTINTDWEWLMCHRGDVVTVAHDVLLNTFGTARIVALLYKDSLGNIVESTSNYKSGDYPVGIMIDDTVVYSEDTRYGIAIRTSSGSINTYELNAEIGRESNMLMFRNAIASKSAVPYVGALCSVATLGNETQNFLVVSINISGDDASAEIELAPWFAKEILESAHSNIPAWEPPVLIPQITPARVDSLRRKSRKYVLTKAFSSGQERISYPALPYGGRFLPVFPACIQNCTASFR